MPKLSSAFEIIKRFDDLPDDAVAPTKVTALVLGVSERTVRYHPQLPRVSVSRGRYGQRVRDIRALVRGGEQVEAKRTILDAG